MTANVEAMLREGIRAYRANNKSEARALLEKVVELDQNIEEAWLWLSAVVDDANEQRICLENVLVLNPNNERAKQGLLSLGASPSAVPPPAVSSDDDMFSGSGFVTPPAAPAAPPSADNPFGSDDFGFIESSVQWGADAEVVAPPPREPRGASVAGPSTHDLDNWISGLGIGGKADESAGNTMDSLRATTSSNDTSDAQGSSGVFGDDDFGDSPFELDSSVFTEGPFTPSAPTSMPEAPPRPAPPKPAPKAEPVMSPMADTLSANKKKTSEQSKSDIFMDENDLFADDVKEPSQASVDPAAYFRMIPKSIKPTRLPGSVERSPVLLLLGTLLLIVMNIGAIALIATKFMG